VIVLLKRRSGCLDNDETALRADQSPSHVAKFDRQLGKLQEGTIDMSGVVEELRGHRGLASVRGCRVLEMVDIWKFCCCRSEYGSAKSIWALQETCSLKPIRRVLILRQLSIVGSG
jgi:hypothetical protein